MSEEIKRLLFIEETYSDESFTGYLLRLTELNYFNRLVWILETSRLKTILTSKTLPGVTSNNNLEILAKLIGINEKILEPLTYKVDQEIPNRINPRYILFGISLPSFLIFHKSSRPCPICLNEKNYLRRIWEFAPITVCPFHQCLLMDCCPKCGKYLVWNRSSVSRCFCGFDFRKAKPLLVSEKELRITRQIYRLCGLAEFDSEVQLGTHLNELNLFYFIRVVFFFASYWAGIAETTGKTLIYYSSNLDLHKCLNFATLIFDDFPRNFFVFLDWIKYQNNLDFRTIPQAVRQQLRQSNEQSLLEGFRISLTIEFDLPQFGAIHEAYEKYSQFGARGYMPRSFFYSEPKLLREVFKHLIKSKTSAVEQ